MLAHLGSINIAFELFIDYFYYLLVVTVSNLVSIYSFLVVSLFFCKQRHQHITNKHYSQCLFRKQVLFYLFLFIFDMSSLLALLLQMFADGVIIHKKTTSAEYTTGVFYLVYCSRCIVLPLIRVMESTLRAEIKSRFRRLSSFTRSSSGNTDNHMIDEDPDIAFLSSSQNNLLVCAILTGIDLTLI